MGLIAKDWLLGGIITACGVILLLASRGKKEKKEPEPQQAPTTTPAVVRKPNPLYEFYAHGTSFRQKELKSLLDDNVEWSMSKKELIDEGREDEKIYKYETLSAIPEFEPEPTNPEDEHAMKILINGVHIGYVPKAKARKVKRLIDEGKITKKCIDVYGGPYKYIEYDEDDKAYLEKGKTNFAAKVYLNIKAES